MEAFMQAVLIVLVLISIGTGFMRICFTIRPFSFSVICYNKMK
jgi:hypothetical protein